MSSILDFTFPSFRIQPPGPPHTYMGIAHSMLPGVKILAASVPFPALPFALVSAHTLECALKAYLSRSGDDSRVKQRDVRHNLIALWALAFADGLCVTEQIPQWVEMLSRIHDTPYYLRYSTGVHIIGSPAPEPMTTDLSALIEQIQTQL